MLWKEFSLRKNQALLSTGVSASLLRGGLEAASGRLAWRRGSGPCRGAAQSAGPGGARPFSAPPPRQAPAFSLLVPSPSRLSPVGDPHQGGKDRTAAPDTKGRGFLGAAVFTARRGSPGGPSPLPAGTVRGAQPLRPQSAPAAGQGSVCPTTPAHPGPRGAAQVPCLTSPPVSGAKRGVLSCVRAAPPRLLKRGELPCPSCAQTFTASHFRSHSSREGRFAEDHWAPQRP